MKALENAKRIFKCLGYSIVEFNILLIRKISGLIDAFKIKR
jgi:hypothetical protein